MRISPLEFFLISYQKNMMGRLAWSLGAFTVTRSNGTEKPEPYIVHYEKGQAQFYNDDGDLVQVDVGKNKAVLEVNAHIDLKPGDLPNIKTKVKTTFGIAYLNAVCLCIYAGDVIDYMNREVDPHEMDRQITQAVKEERLSVHIGKQCTKAIHWVTGLTQIVVPSASVKTMTTNKELVKKRNVKLKENADQLDDPTVLARIETELTDEDKANFKGDPAEIFYKSGKAFNVVRKRMHVMHGAEASLEGGNKMELIPRSLSEGLEVEYLPMLINSLRDGSLSRGHETALGGEIVKFLLRIFQKTKIAEKDCGTKLGWDVTANYITDRMFRGRYYIVNGKSVPYTDEAKKKTTGKVIRLRSPMFCKTKNNNFCATCMGDDVSHSENALSMLATEVGSAFLAMFMAAMHGKSLKLAEYDFKTHIR